MYRVYVLENDCNAKIYIGNTNNLEIRVKRHNGLLPSKLRSYTNIHKGIGTWKVVYKENFKTRKEAVKREKFLKSHKGRDSIRDFLKKLRAGS